MTDENIMTKREGKMFEEINLSLIKESTSNVIGNLSLKMLNSLLAQSPTLVIDTIDKCKQVLKNELTKRISLWFSVIIRKTCLVSFWPMV